jgi:uncharacterized membrane protein YqaE (UPF0057 family)
MSNLPKNHGGKICVSTGAWWNPNDFPYMMNKRDSEGKGRPRLLYLLAIILPPIAVLFVGKPFQALLNLILTLIGWIPGVIHAVLVVNEYKADKRAQRQAEVLAGIRKRV